MTGQDGGQDPSRLEISPSDRYTRAGAYVEGPAGTGPAHGTFLAGGDAVAAPAAVELGESPAAPAGAAPAARFPLRRRGRNIREAGHAAYYDAATPWAGVAAAFEYGRSATARAQTGGMPLPPDLDTLLAAGRALMTVGDNLTAAMHTWSPGA